MKETLGTYYGQLPDGRVLIASALPDMADGQEVRMLWTDSEMISADQRKKIFAIVAEIAEWSGHDPEYVRRNLTADFLRENIERLQLSALSLAVSGNCDKGTASLFIDTLINFCLENDVPTREPLQNYADDLGKYTYAALLHKRCVICGRKSDLHHVDSVGMGFDRREKPQVGALVLPLCREHHQQWHSIGGMAFDRLYHVQPVRLDKRLAIVYGLTKAAQRPGEYR